jgi:hypothetical protein
LGSIFDVKGFVEKYNEIIFHLEIFFGLSLVWKISYGGKWLETSIEHCVKFRQSRWRQPADGIDFDKLWQVAANFDGKQWRNSNKLR